MFKCNKCVSLFNRKDNLLRHEKTHEGIRFPCTLCDNTFKYKPSLKRHEQTVHYTNNTLLLRTVPKKEVTKNNNCNTIAQDKLTPTKTSSRPEEGLTNDFFQYSVTGEFFFFYLIQCMVF